MRRQDSVSYEDIPLSILFRKLRSVISEAALFYPLSSFSLPSPSPPEFLEEKSVNCFLQPQQALASFYKYVLA